MAPRSSVSCVHELLPSWRWDPPGKLHGDSNESAEPLEMMVVEMK
jgi:hypothetical protein